MKAQSIRPIIAPNVIPIRIEPILTQLNKSIPVTSPMITAPSRHIHKPESVSNHPSSYAVKAKMTKALNPPNPEHTYLNQR